MKYTAFGVSICVWIAFGSYTSHLRAQDTQKPKCKVEIVEPKLGESVGADGLVSGRATLPAGKYLWVLSHRKGLGVWWPQGAGSASVTKGEWAVLVNYGQSRDRGAQFEVGVVVVDDSTSAKLDSWVKKGDETGNYPGIPFPAFVDGCEPAKITVTKSQ